MKKIKVVIIGLLVLALGILTACGGSAAKEDNVVKLGINGAETEVWTHI